ncbi:MAG TPA: formate dehydrogenase accessory sulfurtransferase FdhD [Bacillota bacterium]|nr:formate dehydrogenase accessory sulfurtransferase FdhD [Bacillota bacterium]
MNKTIVNGWKTYHFKGDSFTVNNETIATENPLTVMLNGQEFATMVCSPTHLRELLIGFLASEGVIRHKKEITSLSIDEDRGFAYVEVDKPLDLITNDHSKRFLGSCCGKSRQFYFKADAQTAKTVVSKQQIDAKQCFHLMNKMQDESTDFQQTGGVHNAALATTDEILAVRTDIGRHNALDKVYGHIIDNEIPLHDKVIVFSGRISSEVLLKISKMGIGILIANAAPTNLALQLADDLGITAIGFVRNDSMNVYTHPERIRNLTHETSPTA